MEIIRYGNFHTIVWMSAFCDGSNQLSLCLWRLAADYAAATIQCWSCQLKQHTGSEVEDNVDTMGPSWEDIAKLQREIDDELMDFVSMDGILLPFQGENSLSLQFKHVMRIDN